MMHGIERRNDCISCSFRVYGDNVYGLSLHFIHWVIDTQHSQHTVHKLNKTQTWHTPQHQYWKATHTLWRIKELVATSQEWSQWLLQPLQKRGVLIGSQDIACIMCVSTHTYLYISECVSVCRVCMHVNPSSIWLQNGLFSKNIICSLRNKENRLEGDSKESGRENMTGRSQ